MLDVVIEGLLLGGYYALLASGLSLMFGVLRFVNLAHGDLAVAGGFLALYFTQALGLDVLSASVFVIAAMAGLGWLLQAGLFSRAMRGGFLVPLLTTFGLGALIQNGLYGALGGDTRSLATGLGSLAWTSLELPGGLRLGLLPLAIFALSLGVLGLLHLFLAGTRLGRAIRATTEDPEAAGLVGIDTIRVHRLAAAIATGLAGLAGVLLASRALVTPYSGPGQLIFAFEAVVIGGIGSLWGTFVGGILLGVAQGLGSLVSPQWAQLAGHLLFFLVLGMRLLRATSFERGGWRAMLRDRILGGRIPGSRIPGGRMRIRENA